ncbi:MAG: hypothetical protein HW406_2507, partial [Candidatus Brocadiaceae bacterium]|nr:hypothetical protein [Candidatus Brocadiaceae bacterium]
AEGQRVASLGLFGSRPTTPQIFISHNTEPGIENYSVNLPQTVSDYISKLRLNKDILKPTEDEILLGEFEDGKTLTPSEKAKILIERLRHAIKLLETSDDDENSESIKTAIEWTFDSITNDNDTFAFIQACIGLEAILGDDGTKEKLMKTLADRCAYLLGGKISNRRKVREDFEKLYDIRSKLVHGRKVKLDNEQLGFLRFAQNMLESIIWKEISYI